MLRSRCRQHYSLKQGPISFSELKVGAYKFPVKQIYAQLLESQSNPITLEIIWFHLVGLPTGFKRCEGSGN